MMVPLWLVPVVPLLAAIVIAAASRPLSSAVRAGVVATTAAVIATAVAIAVLVTTIAGSVPRATVAAITVAGRPVVLGLQADALSATLALLVAAVSATVLAYSIWYMRGEPSPARFFAVMSLFAAAMVTLILADNYLLLYAAWEIVGICSYLLIGHHWRDPAAASAALKALVVTRIGDMALMLAIACLFLAGGTFTYDALFAAVSNGTLRGPLVSAAAWLLLGGALGKSAQAPLHVWLPDAMAGPTPVSALIHSATMVAAGMYLAARSFPIVAAVPAALIAWLIVTAVTACGAALAASAQRDVKRLLAYSTMSQLGEMGIAIGIAAPAAAMLHLIAHATFKALLFLSAGVATKASGTNELTALGRVPRIATIGFLIGALSLSGIPPFAGFWSRGALSADASGLPAVVFVVLAALSAFYIARALFVAFRHPVTGGDDSASAWHTVPMWTLAAGTIAIGFVPMPFMVASGAPTGSWRVFDAHTGIEVAAALAGWAVAYAMYEQRAPQWVRVRARIGAAAVWAQTGFGVEALATAATSAAQATADSFRRVDIEVFNRAARGAAAIMLQLAALSRRVDIEVFDRAARGAAAVMVQMAGLSRRVDEQGLDRGIAAGAGELGVLGTRVAALQTGRIYHYLFAVFASVVVAAVSMLIVRLGR